MLFSIEVSPVITLLASLSVVLRIKVIHNRLIYWHQVVRHRSISTGTSQITNNLKTIVIQLERIASALLTRVNAFVNGQHLDLLVCVTPSCYDHCGTF